VRVLVLALGPALLLVLAPGLGLAVERVGPLLGLPLLGYFVLERPSELLSGLLLLVLLLLLLLLVPRLAVELLTGLKPVPESMLVLAVLTLGTGSG
jgi:hypothetical protein